MQKLIEELSDFKGKRVSIVGLGKSGVALVRLLSELGSRLVVNDIKSLDDIKRSLGELEERVESIFPEGHPPQALEEADMVVVSPGVPLSTPSIVSAIYKGIPVIGEIEISWQILNLVRDNLKIIGITGSNGKSTTSTLTYEFLKKDGKRVKLAGNIGLPVADVVYEIMKGALEIDYLVLELSSFQLEGIKNFRTNYGAILNITPDHMDRYSGIREYIEAKAKIFQNMVQEDFLVLNMDDKNTIATIELLRNVYLKRGKLPHILYFSRFQRVYGAYLENGNVKFMAREELPDSIIKEFENTVLPVSSFKIKGVHNIENIMASSLLALLAGVSGESISSVVQDFPGLPHRMEFVREIDGVSYFNDSKGTNVDAVKKSLESFSGNVILIAGGRDKDGDFTELRELVKAKVKALILIGEAKEKIAKALSDLVPTYIEQDMESAVRRSKEIAKGGDVVLLSPGCASFDMYRNFEHRGEHFKEVVRSL